LVGVVVGLLAQVHVVEAGRGLVAEYQAHIAMRVILGRALHLGIQNEIADREIFYQGKVERAPIRRLVLTRVKQAIGLALLSLYDFPGTGVGWLPSAGSVLEVVLKDQRQGGRVAARRDLANAMIRGIGDVGCPPRINDAAVRLRQTGLEGISAVASGTTTAAGKSRHDIGPGVNATDRVVLRIYQVNASLAI